MYLAMALLLTAGAAVYGRRKWREMTESNLVKEAALAQKRSRFSEHQPAARPHKPDRARFGQRGGT